MPSSAPVAKDATLFVTFYYFRDPSGRRDLSEPLIRHLNENLRADEQPDGKPQVWLEAFNPVEKSAHDIRVVQLALNATDETESADCAWLNLSQRLGELLAGNHESLLSGMVGYSLVYQAVLKRGIPPLFVSVLPDQAIRRQLLLGKPSAEVINPLATSSTQDGHLWLLDIPLLLDGRHASAVYVAVCRNDANDDFVGKVLWGASASWLLPDLIAHKSYHQIRQYRGIIEGEMTFSQELQQVRHTTLELLTASQNERLSDEFNHLTRTSHFLIRDMAKLGALRITLAKQEYSYSQWLDHAPRGEIVSFHAARIKANLKELELNLAEAETVLQATDTVLNLMQTGLHKAEERRQFGLSIMLATLGAALVVPQLIDRQVTDALWAWWDGELTAQSYNTLQVWGVQLSMTLIIGGLMILLLVTLSRGRGDR